MKPALAHQPQAPHGKESLWEEETCRSRPGWSPGSKTGNRVEAIIPSHLKKLSEKASVSFTAFHVSIQKTAKYKLHVTWFP